MILRDFDWDQLNIEEVLEHSFKDFHVKGMDYLCLKRSDDHTLKVYFFVDAIKDLPEVVNPHDHRYSFHTQCVTGLVRNKWYTKTPKKLFRPGRMYTQFFWDTPLNGGSGFSGGHEVMLWAAGAYTAGPGCDYPMRHDELHTIQVLRPQTCIVIEQYADVVPVGTPTRTFCLTPEPPGINDLYSKLTADEAMKRINLLKELIYV